MSNRVAYIIIGLISFIAFAFLIWLIYIKQKPTSYPEYISLLPLVNCILNAVSTYCLGMGIAAIKKKEITRHMTYMISAFVASTLFLITYIIYHSLQGDTHYLGQGIMKFIYFFTLISHIILTIGALPMILTTFFFALTKRFEFHKKIARYTYPIWLYVSVTGVLIYVLQKI